MEMLLAIHVYQVLNYRYNIFIHLFFTKLVICKVAGMLEPIPVSQVIGRETL